LREVLAADFIDLAEVADLAADFEVEDMAREAFEVAFVVLIALAVLAADLADLAVFAEDFMDLDMDLLAVAVAGAAVKLR